MEKVNEFLEFCRGRDTYIDPSPSVPSLGFLSEVSHYHHQPWQSLGALASPCPAACLETAAVSVGVPDGVALVVLLVLGSLV
jgi:hypothetical protein